MNSTAEGKPGKTSGQRGSSRGAKALGRAVLALLLLVCATSSAARNWNVQAGGSRLEFVPRELTIEPGDTVTWSNLGGLHNVVADNGAFRCANGCDGQGGNGAPSSQIWRATVTFNQPGTFGYFCEPHGQPGGGMYGTITVNGGEPPIPVPLNGLLIGLLLGFASIAAAALAIQRSRG